jgi:hypothetical protein
MGIGYHVSLPASAFRLGALRLHRLLAGDREIIHDQGHELLAGLGERGAVFLAGDQIARAVAVRNFRNGRG